jgi:hypothetical protein
MTRSIRLQANARRFDVRSVHGDDTFLACSSLIFSAKEGIGPVPMETVK